MDRGAWQATVHRVTKSQKQLKQLSTHARHMVRVSLFTWFPQDEIRKTSKTRVVGGGKLFTGLRYTSYRGRQGISSDPGLEGRLIVKLSCEVWKISVLGRS